ncbi:pancreatic triacylglycerol lipase-like [Diprion similis]|uniref:pancreatic triacylglycerol lipase-like n=1 Tax=Diprion similis TaxID=362088 RepID=UPI001EF88D82|nr:pancreatic triacylglycerol lipase-like [Diprion similis]
MKARNVAFLLVTLVFNVIQDSEGVKISTFNLMPYPNGTVEKIDLSKAFVDLILTVDELTKAVKFELYTISNPKTPEKLYYLDQSALSKSHFNASKPTRFVIHGWQNSGGSDVCVFIRDAYLAVRDYNVITVDWSTFSSLDYVSARSNIVAVGQHVGKMIDFLELKGASLKDMIIVGHSLGAHIAGIAARSAKNDVGAVVGLDPAGPLFYVVDTNARMKSTDANYVQIIHTAAGRLGYDGNLGHVDFWVNGGFVQPGCGLDPAAYCAHLRAFEYFAESISHDSFRSLACTNYLLYETGACRFESSSKMGGCDLDVRATGTHYVQTNSARSFAKN